MVRKDLKGDKQLILYETFQEFDKMMSADKVDGRDRSSHSGSSSFCGTRNWEHAEELRMYGDRNSAGMMNKFSSQLENIMEKVVKEKTKNYNDVAGFQPIVPNAIMNLPMSMINQKRVAKKGKIISLYCDMGVNAGIDKDQLAYRGALILSVIDAYEKQGYRVELLTGVSAKGGDKTYGFVLPIKKSGQPLNLLKTAYYIVNPSFLRRTYFQFCESVADIGDITYSGYGQQRNDSERREHLQEFIGGDTVVINSEFLPRESSDESTIEKHIKQLTTMIDYELEKLKKKSEKKRSRN